VVLCYYVRPIARSACYGGWRALTRRYINGHEQIRSRNELVCVEYIVDAATWLANYKNTPPTLEGQASQFVGSPNRYGILGFFELHVWAWQDNPNGAFVDCNNKVSCELQ
jgi:hypothetical protein